MRPATADARTVCTVPLVKFAADADRSGATAVFWSRGAMFVLGWRCYPGFAVLIDRRPQQTMVWSVLSPHACWPPAEMAVKVSASVCDPLE